MREGEKKNKQLSAASLLSAASSHRAVVGATPAKRHAVLYVYHAVMFVLITVVRFHIRARHLIPIHSASLLQLELIHMDDSFPVTLVYCFGPGWQ